MPPDRRPFVIRLLKSLVLPPANLQSNLSSGAERIFASYALVGAVIVFAGLGYLLDWYFDRAPWFLIVSLLVGICLGFYNLLRAAQQK